MTGTNTRQAPRADILLHKNLGIAWCSSSTPTVATWAKGFAFHNGTLLDAKGLGALFAQAVTAAPEGERGQGLEELLRALNGNFAVVVRADGLLLAAVDRVRSIPLFYGEHDGTLYVSDDAFWVKEEMGDKAPDPLSIKEFMLTGYVTGSDTLFPNVKQLQAGECLFWAAGEGGLRLSAHRYYRWIHGNYDNATEEELCQKMDSMLVRVFERLLETTKGRTIVVPLSGGLDSRLVVTMLKRLGRQDVICFSYGRPGNRQSEVSQRVAEALGYPWRFVPYSLKAWQSWYNSTEWQAYSRYACGLCSLPAMQDWPAVWMLRERGQIPADAVFVPGHTAVLAIQANEVDALVRGAHLQGMDLLRAALWSKHYSLWRCKENVLEELFGDKLRSILGDLPCASPEDIASALDLWAWQERQAKFIINTLRTYEFWGYDWRIPLWNSEMMDYWARIPLHLRVRKRLYKGYVPRAYEAAGLRYSILIDAPSPDHDRPLAVAKTALGGTPLWPAVKVAWRAAHYVKSYWSHPLAWYGINSLYSYLRQALSPDGFSAGNFCINSILSRSEMARWGIEDAVSLLRR